MRKQCSSGGSQRLHGGWIGALKDEQEFAGSSGRERPLPGLTSRLGALLEHPTCDITVLGGPVRHRDTCTEDMCSSCDPGLCLPGIDWSRQDSPLAYLESNTCQQGSNSGCGPLGLISLHSPDNSADPSTSTHIVHTQFAHHFQGLKDISQRHCSIAEPQYGPAPAFCR